MTMQELVLSMSVILVTTLSELIAIKYLTIKLKPITLSQKPLQVDYLMILITFVQSNFQPMSVFQNV